MNPPQPAGPSGTAAPSAGRERLFFALWPDEATRAGIEAAAQALKRAPGRRGRWTSPRRYHLTLQFLGDFAQMPPALPDDAAAAAAAAATLSPPFQLQLDVAGSFHNRSIPWWLGCSTVPPGLGRLRERLGMELARTGVRMAASPPLVPHVTVLRDAGGPLPETAITPVPWSVDSFVLIHSRPDTRNGYRFVGEWRLRG